VNPSNDDEPPAVEGLHEEASQETPGWDAWSPSDVPTKSQRIAKPPRNYWRHLVAIGVLIAAVRLAPFLAGPARFPNEPIKKSPSPLESFIKSNQRVNVKSLPTERTVRGISLRRTTVAGRASLLIPNDFTMLDDESINLKFPDSRRPQVVYSDETGAVTVAVRRSSYAEPVEDLEKTGNEARRVMKQQYADAVFRRSGVVKLHDQDWYIMDLQYAVTDTQIRNLIAMTYRDHLVFLVNVNFTKELEDQWLEPANAIIESLYVTP